MATPAALEGAGVHVVHEHAFVQETVRDVDLARILVEIECPDAGREDVGLLIVHLYLVARDLWSAVAEVPEELALARELDDAVAGHGPRDVDVLVAVHTDRLKPTRPTWMVIRASPSVDDVPFGIEVHDHRTDHAAVRPRRSPARAHFIGPCIDRAIDDPDVIVPINIDIDDLLHAPFVGQRLWPERVYLKDGRALRIQDLHLRAGRCLLLRRGRAAPAGTGGERQHTT